MGQMTDLTGRLGQAAREQARHYADGRDRPLGGYLTLIGVYSGVIGGLSLLAWRSGRRLPAVGAGDVALAAAATHRLSRLISKDPVTSPLRAPFTRYEGVAGPSELSEQVRGHGVQHAVGELLTCPFCVSMWVATGIFGGLVFVPRFTRLCAATFTAVEAADFLQVVYSAGMRAAEEDPGPSGARRTGTGEGRR
jgi:hypothetical protein